MVELPHGPSKNYGGFTRHRYLYRPIRFFWLGLLPDHSNVFIKKPPSTGGFLFNLKHLNPIPVQKRLSK